MIKLYFKNLGRNYLYLKGILNIIYTEFPKKKKPLRNNMKNATM